MFYPKKYGDPRKENMMDPLADRATDTTLAVWVWSAKPDEAQLRQAMQEFSAQIRDLTAGPPSPEWYEVLQHI